MRASIIPILLLCSAASLVRAQTKTDPVTEPVRTDWREGLFTEIPAALDIATKQQRGVLVCFSGDPLGDNSVVAQVFRAKKVRDWATEKKLNLALIEFPRPGSSDAEEGKARFFELTRRFKIAGSRTWVALDAT